MVIAARADTAARSSLKFRHIFGLIGYFFAFITEAHITYDRNTLINLIKGNAGVGLSAADFEMILRRHDIFQPPSQTSCTKRHHKLCDHPRKRVEIALKRAKQTQLGAKAIPVSLHTPQHSTQSPHKTDWQTGLWA